MKIDWCDVCFDDTEHFVKVKAGRVACKRCRKRRYVRKSAKRRRDAEAPIRAAARLARNAENLRLRLEAVAARQAEKLAAVRAPRYCPRCDAVTEREVRERGTRCLPCALKHSAVRNQRKAAIKAAASPSMRERHIANPHMACPSGHHDWNSQGYCRTCLRLRHRWNMSDPEKVAHAMWKRAKGRALAKGLPFSIGPVDCCVPAQCPVFGPFELGAGKRIGMTPSLDRIDPALGYVPGNVIVISGLANTIKNCWTREQLRAVAECDAIWPKA